MATDFTPFVDIIKQRSSPWQRHVRSITSITLHSLEQTNKHQQTGSFFSRYETNIASFNIIPECLHHIDFHS